MSDFYALAKRLPADEYAIVIVGQRTEDIKQVENGCQIVFVDRTQNALELAQLYSSASVFVNPTYQDNYPTTNLEAMGCGCPIASSDVGAIPEMLDIDGDACGVCFKSRNPDEVYRAVSFLIDNDEKKRSFVAKAKARVNKLYAIPQVWGQMINIWNQSIDK